jgi:hypothetical protein
MQINISSKFMKNYESGSPVSSDREIATAMDENGDIMFFSIGSDDRLYFFKKDAGTPTGWRRTDLSTDIGAKVEVTHIATAQDRDGKPILAATVYDNEYRNNPKVYFTKNFSTEPTSDRWYFRGNLANVEITHIATGADRHGNTLIVISTQQEDKMTNYLVNPNLGDKSWLWKEIPVPLNGKGLIDLAIGHNQKLEQIDGVDAVLYMLISIDGSTSKVITTSLPDFDFYNRQIPIDFSPTAMGIIPDHRGNSELFLATDRLYHLDIQAQMTQDTSNLTSNIIGIGTKNFTHTAKAIINGRYASGDLEAWVLTKDGNLYFTQENDSGGWQEPYPLDKEIGQITGWRNSSTDEIDLFAVNIDNQLHHLWQDLTTTRWKERQIMLGGINNSVEYDSYTSQISIADDQGFPLPGQTVTVKASELTMVKINGNQYFVDPMSDAVTCKTDAMGNITIVNKVTSMTSPIVRIEADFLDKALDLNPNKHIADRLANLTADDLKNARLQTDEEAVTEPLIKNPDKIDLTGVHQAVQELISLQHKLPAKPGDINAQIPASSLNSEGIAVADKGSPLSHQLDLISIPNSYSWGLDVSGSSPVFSNQKDYIQANYLTTYNRKLAAMSTASFGGIFDGIEHFFGDVWRAIKKGFFTVTHFVIEKVEEGIKIIINGIEDAVHVIVKFAEQVWDVIQLVFEKIGVFFKDLIRFVGYLFKWKDILRTHTVLKDIFNKSFDYTITKLNNAEGDVSNFFNTLKTKVLGQDLVGKLQQDHANAKILGSAPGGNSILSSPEVNWTFHHVSGGNIIEHGPSTSGINGISLASLAEDEIQAIEKAFKELGQDFVENLRTLSIGEFFTKLLAILEEAVIDSLKNITLGLIELVKSIVSVIKQVLNARWDIPVLTPLYENAIAPGSTLSLIDLVCLLTAIPATVLYKIAVGSAPFTDNDVQAIARTANFQELTQHLAQKNVNNLPKLSRLLVATRGSTATILAEEATDTNPTPLAARIISYILGFANGIASAMYGVANGLQMAYDEPPKSFDLFKLVTGGLATGTALISMLMVDIWSEPANEGLYGFETGITVYQLAFNFKDTIALFGFGKNLEQSLSWVETGFGAGNAALFLALFIWEMVTHSSIATNIPKFIPQNLATAAIQIACGPATAAEDPRVKIAAGIAMGAGGLISGVTNMSRIAMDIKNAEIHRNN